KDQWLGPLEPLLAGDGAEHSRGLVVANVASRRLGRPYVQALADTEAWAWVEEVSIWSPLVGLPAALDSPLMASVPRLSLGTSRAADVAWWLRIAACPGLAGLLSLGFGNGRLPADGLAALAASPHLQRLRELSLYPIDTPGKAVAHLEGH